MIHYMREQLKRLALAEPRSSRGASCCQPREDRGAATGLGCRASGVSENVGQGKRRVAQGLAESAPGVLQRAESEIIGETSSRESGSGSRVSSGVAGTSWYPGEAQSLRVRSGQGTSFAGSRGARKTSGGTVIGRSKGRQESRKATRMAEAESRKGARVKARFESESSSQGEGRWTVHSRRVARGLRAAERTLLRLRRAQTVNGWAPCAFVQGRS